MIYKKLKGGSWLIRNILESRIGNLNDLEDRLDIDMERISICKDKLENKEGFTDVLMFEEVVLSTLEFLNKYRTELESFLTQEDISFDKYSKTFKSWDEDFLSILKELDVAGASFDELNLD